jgi:predicted ATPase
MPKVDRDISSFATAAAHSELHRFLRLTRSVRGHRDGYFLRAESFFSVASEMERLDAIPVPAPPVIDAYGGPRCTNSHTANRS